MSVEARSGNAITLEITLKSNNVAITDLATATKVEFALTLKGNSTPALTVAATPPPASGITIDDPATGDVKVVLTPTQTNLAAGIYHISVQVTYSSSNIIEWVEDDGLILKEDFIP